MVVVHSSEALSSSVRVFWRVYEEGEEGLHYKSCEQKISMSCL